MKLLKDRTAVITLLVFVAGYSVLWSTGATNMKHLLDDLAGAYFLFWGLYALLSEESRTEMRSRFVLTTSVFVLMILGLELLAVAELVDYRLVFPASNPKSALQQPGNIYDRELIHLRKPYFHATGTIRMGNIAEYFCLPSGHAHPFDVRYDRNGFRNASDLDTADITVIGDSYVEATDVLEPEMLTTILASLERRKVANLGMSGYGPQQELQVLKRFALPLRPKTVIWIFYEGNDLENVREYAQEVPLLRSQAPWITRIWFPSFSRNVLGALLQTVRACPPTETFQNQTVFFRDRAGDQIPLYFLDRESLNDPDQWTLDETVNILSDASEATREQGIRLIVVFAPTRYRVYRDLPNVKPAQAFDGGVVNDLPTRLGAMLKKAAPHIDYLDLTVALRGESAQGTLLYFEDDTHWNAEGHRFVAQTIHRFLSSTRTASQ